MGSAPSFQSKDKVGVSIHIIWDLWELWVMRVMSYESYELWEWCVVQLSNNGEPMVIHNHSGSSFSKVLDSINWLVIIKKSIYPGNERQRIDLKWWSYFCTNCNREKSQMATSIINMELSDWAIRIYAIHLPPSCHVFHNLRLWLRIKHGSLQPGGHGGPPDDLGIPPNKKCWKKKFFSFYVTFFNKIL